MTTDIKNFKHGDEYDKNKADGSHLKQSWKNMASRASSKRYAEKITHLSYMVKYSIEQGNLSRRQN